MCFCFRFSETGERRWSPIAVDFFEMITYAHQSKPIKMRVLRRGFDNFLRQLRNTTPVDGDDDGSGDNAAALADHQQAIHALANRAHATTEAVEHWGPQVDEMYQVFLFTPYGEELLRLNDVSAMMHNAGFAELRTVPR